ncbi:protein-tyrosine-phosphatase [Sphingomonas sp. DBB INV C78]|uniref:tyrosine-protein phosphatase n=1 Tax=Sphingomonas sp. DBB INV C78 TaxID=3349434 RepID=UPI0036D35732
MNNRGSTFRFAVAASIAAAVPLLAGCATGATRAPAAISEEQSGVIPFTSASVNRVADNGDAQINWSAPGAGRVTVYAGHDPEQIARDKPVGHGDAIGGIRVSGLMPGKRWFFALVPEHGAPLVIADRGLHLATIPNLRDIGGYRTNDGRWVKMGMIYRSDQLDRLSDADLAAMGGLGLTLVADLRTETERQREPDRVPAGAQPLVLDVAADSTGSLGGDMKKAGAAIMAGKGAALMVDANRDFVTLSSAKAAYAGLLDRLDDPTAGGTLYHCTAGKDRTGWATAVILTLLGVPRETVMADYLASNEYLRAKNEATITSVAKMMPREKLEPVLGVRAEYIQAAFDEVEKSYGSFDAYLKDGLGLDGEEINALRTRYLTGEAARR